MLLLYISIVVFFFACLSLFIALLCYIDNDSYGGNGCALIGCVLLITIFIQIHIDNKYYKPKRLEEKQIKLHNKYKNGPVEIKKNTIGCTKYKYYQDYFWTCPNKNISYIEEQEGKMIAITPVVNKI